MYLIDTNIFLETLLEQEKSKLVNSFLQQNSLNKFSISYFSLCSIGIILSQKKRFSLFQTFVNETIKKGLTVHSLVANEIDELVNVMNSLSLDFDDAYQYQVCKKHKLAIITFDKDFEKTDLQKIKI